MLPIRVFVAMFLVCGPAFATTYYVDFARGSDANAGRSQATAWKSLAKISAAEFQPGDRVLLHAGSVWNEQLQPRSSGAPNAPIVPVQWKPRT